MPVLLSRSAYVALAVMILGAATVASAQVAPRAAGALPPPEAPEVIVRSDDGRATIRAQRIATPIRVDGRLDEAVYDAVRPMSGFYQLEPAVGIKLEDDQTDVWLLFDDEYVYVAARCWDSDPSRIISNEQRRDASGIIQGDYVGFILDTFYDRRNGVIINIGAAGGRRDGLVTDERQFNADWNGVFASATGRFEGGWVAEIAVPFKTLRYLTGRDQLWSFNVQRQQTWRNHKSYLMPMIGLNGGGALMRLSMAATVVGVQAPPAARNMEVKPFALASVSGVTQPASRTTLDGAVGLDAKYGITNNLTADFTVNTDFAQVEVDEQQINLTRFNLFFPEKREFFLENAGLFAFAGATGTASPVPLLFYSRRIGLNRGAVVPINAGARVTGRQGPYSLGAMVIRTGEDAASRSEPTAFSVFRLKRNVFRRGSIGALLTTRSVAASGPGSNQAYGVDGSFGFFTNLAVNTYWAGTSGAGTSAGRGSYRGQVDYNSDRYGAQFDRLEVGKGFRPDVGFVGRGDMRRDYGFLRFSPRPVATPSIRKLTWSGSFERITNTAGRLETRTVDGAFSVDLRSGDGFGATYVRNHEFLPSGLRLASTLTVPAGAYDAAYVRVNYGFGQQRPVSGTVFVERGSFYGGRRTTGGVSGGRVSLTTRFSVSPSVTVNRVDLPFGRFTTTLLTTRIVYTATPLAFISALVQYNSSTRTLSTNARLRWEYRPGSEMFVVYNDERDTRTPGLPGLLNRAFIVKVNRLVRF